MTILDHPGTTDTRPDIPRPDILSVGPARLLAGAHRDHRVDLVEHRSLHPAPSAFTRDELARTAAAVHLLGRGGGAFPVDRKLTATPVGTGTRIVVNGSESEPASLKDRTLMRHVPHLVLDGAIVVAQALGTVHVTVTVHDEESAQSLAAARLERPDATTVSIDRSEAGFVGGEARSVVNRLSGRAAVPGGRRVLPSDTGVDGRPTFLSNVETFAQLGWLASHGADAYAAAGTPGEPGGTLATLLGDMDHPGVVEVPHGIRIGLLTGRPGAAVLLGGYHGTWTTDTGVMVEREPLRRAGLSWGAGVVAVLPEATCPWGELSRVARWLADQSAGQCGPCRFGLASIADDVVLLHAGDGTAHERLRRRLGLVVGRGACAHPDGTSRFLASALEVFDADARQHATHGGCGRPILGVLPVGEETR